jgi:ribosomal protein S21
MIEVKKREGENGNALLFRFTKRMKRSGVLKEAGKRRFYTRKVSKIKRRISAIHRTQKKAEYLRTKQLG